MRPVLVYKKYLEYLLLYGNLHKVNNLLRNRKEARQGKASLSSMPYKVTIDPGNMCNLTCPGCHTGVKHPDMMGPKMLRYPDFKTIFDQVSPQLFHLSMYNWGEPFLNKELFDMVAYAGEKRVATTIHSNLNHFNEKMAINCVKSGLTHIYLSIDGATQENYEKYRRKGSLEKVMEHLHLLLETRKSMKSRFPYVTWKFLVFDHNRHEQEAAKAFAGKIGVDSFESFRATETLMDIADEAAQFRAEPARFASLPERCASLWSSVYVGPDGSIFPCSLAFRETEVFGNLLQQPLSEVWNNEKYRSARQFFAEGTASDTLPSPCNQCKFYYRCQALAKGTLGSGAHAAP